MTYRDLTFPMLPTALRAAAWAAALCIAGSGSAVAQSTAWLEAGVNGSHREAANRARDVYRHPLETLTFFGLQPTMRVLEISPSRGWYTEVLAPVIRPPGELVLASFGPDHPLEYLAKVHVELMEKLAADPRNYGDVQVTNFQDTGYLEGVADESMDMVLTFRNTHNWVRDGVAEDIYRAFARVLRPGGTLGVVQHRAAEDADPQRSAPSGYLPESHVIALAEQAGLRFAARSEINANPRDTRDYPEGVWTLPPSYRLEDQDRDKYTAIGESDRMTLRFIKP